MQRERQAFRRFLGPRRLRVAPQREPILAEVLRQERQITAAELYDLVKRQEIILLAPAGLPYYVSPRRPATRPEA
jgi:Fe2+ or Zn2+ uptake regulation protein